MPSPQFAAHLERLRGAPYTATQTVEVLRANIAARVAFPLPPDVSTEAVDANGVPAEWIAAPNARPGRALLYLHGGGYYRGSINTVREMCSRISRAAGMRVLAADYRLAPEHPFPAAVEDTQSAYAWMLEQEGVEHTAVGGDSAGGGLTLALLLARRDAGESLPAAAVCLSPWTDLAMSGASMTARAASDPSITRVYLERFAALYLNGEDATTPLASPLYGDLAGLPPLLIQVGTAETLFDDSQRLADKARAAGVTVELEPWQDMVHVWQNAGPDMPESRQAVARIGAFLQQRLG